LRLDALGNALFSLKKGETEREREKKERKKDKNWQSQ
jgi:hypothetical protein